ncbi:MAG: TlpA family protein disulfide reductase [Acidobacteria bacterium]|nr:TlpA family protein disulfide reductase [Acidobacteriota bacterium]
MALPAKRHLLPALIGLLTAGFLAVLWPSFQNAGGTGVAVGEEAPEFQLMSDAGQTIQLKDFKGKFIVVNFWATWCPPCVEEMPSLNRFHQRFASRGVVVLGVSVDDNPNAYQQFLKRAGVQFLTVRDPERKVSRQYGTFKYPETYFIDRQGKVIQKIIGMADWNDQQMIDYMEQLLRG